MKLCIPVFLMLVVVASNAFAQTGDGYVGIYANAAGTSPCTSVAPYTGTTLYVIAKTSGGSANGITGAEFRIEVTSPSGWFISYNPPAAANVASGNPIDTDPNPNAGGGLNVSFPSCQVPSGGQVSLGTLSVFNAGASPTNLLVKRHSQPSNSGFACALFVKCDDPYFTKVCMTSAPPDSCVLGAQKTKTASIDDPTVFAASLNEGGGDSDEPPSDPDREVLALFVRGIVQLPSGETHATLASTAINSSAVESVLESHSVEHIAKAYPNFEPADAVAVGRTGKTVLLQNLSEIYKFLLPQGGNPTLLAQDLTAIADEVGYAEPISPAVLHSCPNDPYLTSHQWALQNSGEPTPENPTCTPGADIQFCDAYAITPGSAVTIAIMDTGVDPTHPDLGGRVLTPGADNNGHGTHIAGIAAAGTNNGGIAGVDGNALIMSKPLSSPTAIRDAAEEGAAVLNCSWGSPVRSTDMRIAFRDAYMLNSVAVASMGNGGTAKWYPAAFGQGIIAVGSTDCNDVRSFVSTTGRHIDVAAPGDLIWSTVPFAVNPLGYRYDTGTSMAAPHVSGLAALLLAASPWLYNDDIEQLIRLSADDVNAADSLGFDWDIGMGRINAKRALQLLQFPHALYQETATGGSVFDSTSQYTLNFFVPPDTLFDGGNFRVRRFEVRKSVTFPVTFDSIPHVWGRGAENATIGYSNESPNYNMGWCEADSASITTSGCILRTFVYEVKRYPLGDEFLGWWPARYDSVQFGYSVLGTATLTDAASDPAGTIVFAPKLWSANPLRPGAAIAFSIPQDGNVRIDIFDVAGRRVRVLRNEQFSQGRHELRWNGLADEGRALAAGLYFVRLETPAGVATRKLVVVE